MENIGDRSHNQSGMMDQSNILNKTPQPMSDTKKHEIEIKKALRRANIMKKRWRNENAGGPHSSMGEYNNNYGDDSFYSDEEMPIEKRLI